MRKSFLWLDPLTSYLWYDGAGNVQAGPGEKGTLAIWQETSTARDCGIAGLYWDDNNWIGTARTWGGGPLCAVKAAGTVQWDETGYSVWNGDLIVVTWDWSAGAGNGAVVFYGDDEQIWASTGLDIPSGGSLQIVLGATHGPYAADAPLDDYRAHPQHLHGIFQVAVWDDVMSLQQVQSLYGEGRRHRIEESDGAGTLLFLAPFEGGYDAAVATGSASLTAETAGETYALVNDGIREQGRKRFPVGTPQHNESEYDRIPIQALVPGDHTNYDLMTYTNETNYGKVVVAAGERTYNLLHSPELVETNNYDEGFWDGASILWRVRVPDGGVDQGDQIYFGPLEYIHYEQPGDGTYDQYMSGRRFTVQAGSTAQVINTDLGGDFAADYFNGAQCFLPNETTGGHMLLVSDYAADGTITLDGQLSAAPSEGDLGALVLRSRLIASGQQVSDEYGYNATLLTTLWESHPGYDPKFVEVEWACAYDLGANQGEAGVLYYNRGAGIFMQGDPRGGGTATGFSGGTSGAEIWFERFEVKGPQRYQLLRRDGAGRGPDYADNFMIVAGGSPTFGSSEGQYSTKVWRSSGVKHERMTSWADGGGLTKGETWPIAETGTWREQVLDSVIVPQASTDDTKVLLVLGQDAGGTAQLGYVEATWDDDAGKLVFTDESPPAGKSNPFAEKDNLLGVGPEEVLYWDGADGLDALYQEDDGTWTLVYQGHDSHPDGFQTYILTGATDRWSFDRQEHWWDDNPVCAVEGSPPKFAADGEGDPWRFNRDTAISPAYNPYAYCDEERIVGWGRGKGHGHRAQSFCAEKRATIGVVGRSARSLRSLPFNTGKLALAASATHQGNSHVLGQSDCFGISFDDGSTGGWCLRVSEDGIHWQGAGGRFYFTDPRDFADPAPADQIFVQTDFSIAGKHVWIAGNDSWHSYFYGRDSGITWYALDDGEAAGILETSAMEEPDNGWGQLELNVDPGDGTLTVEVLDASDETVLSGYGTGDFDGVGDTTGSDMTWSGAPLAALDTDYIRLRFHFSRPGGTDTSPKLYSWKVTESPTTEAERPTVGATQVTAATGPAGVEISWDYDDPNGLPQTAYQVIVASSETFRDAHNGDIYDSGVVTAAGTSVTIPLSTLGGGGPFYFDVRVRNSYYDWSEDWS